MADKVCPFARLCLLLLVFGVFWLFFCHKWAASGAGDANHLARLVD